MSLILIVDDESDVEMLFRQQFRRELRAGRFRMDFALSADDLKKFDVPTLVMHGEDDQIVPVKDSAQKSAKLIKRAKEIYYPGAPHGLTATLQDQVNADLLAFIAEKEERKAA